MRPMDIRIEKLILDAVDVWSSCGCESYEWSVDKDIEFDVIDVVDDELRADWRSMRTVAASLGMTLEQVDDVITRFLDEAINTPRRKRTQTRKLKEVLS